MVMLPGFSISILHKYDYNTMSYRELHNRLKFQFYISTIIILALGRILVAFHAFQFYISTIIIGWRHGGQRTDRISILHKYDYNSVSTASSRAISSISILHKYDYNPVTRLQKNKVFFDCKGNKKTQKKCRCQ